MGQIIVYVSSKMYDLLVELCPALQALYLGGDANQIAFLAGGSLLLVPIEVAFQKHVAHQASWAKNVLY